MESHTQQRPITRHGLYVAVACSLLGNTNAHWGQPLAFATPRVEENPLKRERESEVRLFSRGPDTVLSAATLSYTGDSYQVYGGDAAVLDPFDPNFRPTKNSPWGPSPVSISADGTTVAAPALDVVAPAEGEFKIYCDLDGVLVDFEAGVQKICRQSTAELAKTTMWQKIEQSNTAFFADLPWMPDGPQLWEGIRHLKPDILTGVPDLQGSCSDKFQWCRDHLGMEEYRHVDMAARGFGHSSVNGIPKEQEGGVTNIITCWSYNKHHESGHQAVLIDDRIALQESWVAKGGIFVHHTNAKSTLRKLRELGILEDEKTLRP